MQDLLFYIFSGLTLLCGLLVVANPFTRNPVTSAMFLTLTIASMAGLFVLLQAFFLAAVQVLVYAGAVIVLFLFVIMLLDLKEEQKLKIKPFALGSGLLAVAAILYLFSKAVSDFELADPGPGGISGSTEALGRVLFTEFLLPFELVSLLLLVAMIGVILLSKKEIK